MFNLAYNKADEPSKAREKAKEPLVGIWAGVPLLALKQYVFFDDIPKIETYITTKSWWDTVDFLCKVIGDVGLRDTGVRPLMLEWSKRENIWIKRAAIEHQLASKGKNDTELLEQIIVNCLGSNEFFINKAIGWALRENSKTNPQWVRDFIEKHKGQMLSSDT